MNSQTLIPNQSFVPKKYVIKSPVTALTFEEQMFLILNWARRRESRMVCLANVHMLMEAYWKANFATVLESADLIAADGMPLVWMLRQMRIHSQNRVAGMDVFQHLCQHSSECNVSIYFVGSEAEVLEGMRKKLQAEYPHIQIAGMEPLPFRPLTEDEDQALIEKINNSGAGLVFVCLGCPKQENWMFEHRRKINAVMLGLGAVFPLYAGLQKRAPQYLRESGLEWFYRLVQEPKRLWKRYSQTIPPFIWLAVQQLYRQYRQKKAHYLADNSPQFLPNNLNHEKFDLSELNELINDFTQAKIGEILVNQNLLSQDSLAIALQKQHLSNNQQKIGEILVQQGFISSAELEYHLNNQTIKLGELLVQKKLVTRKQLQQWLNNQRSSIKRLGEIAVEKRILSDEELKDCLLEQYFRRKGLWLTDQGKITS